MRRAVAIDTGYRAFPRPDNRSGDVQAFAVRELLQAITSDLESARRLVRACEQTTGEHRQRTLLGLLESLDALLVNCGIYADDGASMSEDIARTLRGLTLDARIESEWLKAHAQKRTL